jgi:ATP-binding cassette subfamily F protein uup
MSNQALISTSGIRKFFGADPLFSDLSIIVKSGDRAGVIGPKGCGKSTLLRILAGLEAVDDGSVACPVSGQQEEVFYEGKCCN